MNTDKLKHIPWKRWYYHLYRRVFTFRSLVVGAAALLTLSWIWGAIQVMQVNYQQQQRLAENERQLRLAQIEVETAEYLANYYASDEYKELAIRSRLGWGKPGEKVLIVPPATSATKALNDTTSQPSSSQVKPSPAPTNAEQWFEFLFGKRNEDLQKNK